jgi:hypothetical protein
MGEKKMKMTGWSSMVLFVLAGGFDVASQWRVFAYTHRRREVPNLKSSIGVYNRTDEKRHQIVSPHSSS